MRPRDRLRRLPFRPHLPQRTVRLRLTALYGALFLASGAALLAITYVLVSHATGVVTTSHLSVSIRSPHPVPVPTPGIPHRIADPTAQQLLAQAHASELHQLLVNSGIAIGLMAVVSISLGWIVAGRVLRPLRTITTAARHVSATNLHQRLALAGPQDELKELGDTFDELLGRLESSFQAQRQFVANASHELRTPLARQRTLIQVALGDPEASVNSLRAAHERVLAAGTQLERLIDMLLTLSRGQAGLDRREPFDLAAVTDQVLLARYPEAERRGLVVYPALSPAPAFGDPRLVERLVANLVDNALRHNVAHGRVEVATGTRSGHAVLSVINTGPVVASAEVDRLFQPFQRLGTERTGHGDGLGLGLSIVQAIATAHGATLSARAQSEGGLHIDVSFPAAAIHVNRHAEPSLPAAAIQDGRSAGRGR